MSIRSNVIIINRVTVLVEHDIRTRFDELELDGARGTGGGYEVAGLVFSRLVGKPSSIGSGNRERVEGREGGRAARIGWNERRKGSCETKWVPGIHHCGRKSSKRSRENNIDRSAAVSQTLKLNLLAPVIVPRLVFRLETEECTTRRAPLSLFRNYFPYPP